MPAPPALPEVVAEAARPPAEETVEAVLERLHAVHRALGNNTVPESHRLRLPADSLPDDGLSAFNHLYTVITADIKKCLDDGEFKCPDFIRILDVTFAERYLRALREYASENPEGTPSAWRTIIERRADPDIEPVQFAVAGVNAHINYDLPIALVKTCKLQGIRLGSGGQYHDFYETNNVFFHRIPEMREHFENHLEKAFDSGLVRLIANRVDDVLMVADRDAAWLKALELWRLSKRRRKQEEVRLDDFVAITGDLILVPVRFALARGLRHFLRTSRIRWFIHRFERHSLLIRVPLAALSARWAALRTRWARLSPADSAGRSPQPRPSSERAAWRVSARRQATGLS